MDFRNHFGHRPDMSSACNDEVLRARNFPGLLVQTSHVISNSQRVVRHREDPAVTLDFEDNVESRFLDLRKSSKWELSTYSYSATLHHDLHCFKCPESILKLG